jgi:hypothetical protein
MAEAANPHDIEPPPSSSPAVNAHALEKEALQIMRGRSSG